MKAFGRPLAASHRILPGFRLSLGYTLVYLTVLVGRSAGGVPGESFAR